jgi:hypothetical protein
MSIRYTDGMNSPVFGGGRGLAAAVGVVTATTDSHLRLLLEWADEVSGDGMS